MKKSILAASLVVLMFIHPLIIAGSNNAFSSNSCTISAERAIYNPVLINPFCVLPDYSLKRK